MLQKDNIKALVFDYGGTIDTNGLHWAEVIWRAYQALEIPIGRECFREAYVQGERALGSHPLVEPRHNFWHVLRLKAEAQMQWLQADGHLSAEAPVARYVSGIADWCYAYAQSAVNAARPVLKDLSAQYPMVLVSNFYGNLHTVLADFHLDGFFRALVESAAVGVRKPDPAIFRLGVEKAGFPAAVVAVVGDSYDKDILPARSLGCQTIWLKKAGWMPFRGDETAEAVINDFAELRPLLLGA
ncbi:MAG: HAD family hydrolase [Tannerella sp.]|jgi:putative hydrolase of the HAD superfamily|nr:HAD family hydrolase [Tannerella sp.]